MIDRNRPTAEVSHRLGAIERSLVEADADRDGLVTVLAQLDPERASADLKRALRTPGTSEDLVASLRRRHETVNDLLNRLGDLDQRVETTLVDLETLAARSAEVALLARGRDDTEEHLARLDLDLAALAEAHRELADL
jgi:hypothetical protein